MKVQVCSMVYNGVPGPANEAIQPEIEVGIVSAMVCGWESLTDGLSGEFAMPATGTLTAIAKAAETAYEGKVAAMAAAKAAAETETLQHGEK